MRSLLAVGQPHRFLLPHAAEPPAVELAPRRGAATVRARASFEQLIAAPRTTTHRRAPRPPRGTRSALCRSMKPVSILPSTNAGWRNAAIRNARLVRDARDLRRLERVRQPRQRAAARLVPGDDLGDHRIVEHRHLAALDDAGIDTHMRVVLPAASAAQAARSTARSPSPDLRHRAAPRPHGR